MHPPSPQPPVFAPPPAPTSSLKWIWAALIGGLILLIGMCGLGGYAIYSFAQAEPKPHDKFGVFQTQPLDGDWVRAKFECIEATLDLPEVPTKSNESFTAGDRLLYSKWSSYEIGEDHTLRNFWTTVSQNADELADFSSYRAYYEGDSKLSERGYKLDGRSVSEFVARYDVDGKPYFVVHSLLGTPRLMIEVSTFGFQDDEKQLMENHRRILKSLKPSGSNAKKFL